MVLTIAIGLVAAGATGTYWKMRPRPAARATPQPAAADHALAHAPQPDVSITLPPDVVERAHIVTGTVTAVRDGQPLRLPAVVEPNAYRQVVVTPLVAGRVTRVLVELGQHVARGQTMAEIFSPELAEAETRYVSARAELDAHERELQRTEKLVQIGAATREELEARHAEHTSLITRAETARSRLELLGLSAAQIGSLVSGKPIGALTAVPAPIAGVVTERTANTGGNIDAATRLFTVVDLSSVWIVADVYEKDFSRVHPGSRATVTTTAYPDAPVDGTVSYVDPQVNPQTRTAKARIEIANPQGRLKLGMFADVSIHAAGEAVLPSVPVSAVQYIGDRAVLYVADPARAGTFIEREIRIGTPSGGRVPVLEGVRLGETIVTEGSFSIRAERER
jgi:RND family efflux transporter MFP subunit